jgi:hypothetical protein
MEDEKRTVIVDIFYILKRDCEVWRYGLLVPGSITCLGHWIYIILACAVAMDDIDDESVTSIAFHAPKKRIITLRAVTCRYTHCVVHSH